MISEELVEEIWRETASMTPHEARRRIERLTKLQPALAGFVAAEFAKLSRDVAALGYYLFLVIARMFYGAGPKVRRVPFEAMEAVVEEMAAQFAQFEHADSRFLEQPARVLCAQQPHVFRYLTEALVEAPEDEVDPVPLTPEDEGILFLILASVIRVLDERGLPHLPRRDETDETT